MAPESPHRLLGSMMGCGDKGWATGGDPWPPMLLFPINTTAAYTHLTLLPPHSCSRRFLPGIHSSFNKYLNTFYVPGSGYMFRDTLGAHRALPHVKRPRHPAHTCPSLSPSLLLHGTLSPKMLS